MKIDIKFISQNIAPRGAKEIAIYNSKGDKVGKVPLGRLSCNSLGNKLYSFGLVSDIHLTVDTALDDYQRALTYFTEVEKVFGQATTGTAKGYFYYNLRKFAHVFEFMALGISLALVYYSSKYRYIQKLANFAFLCSAIAVLDETIQFFHQAREELLEHFDQYLKLYR